MKKLNYLFAITFFLNVTVLVAQTKISDSDQLEQATINFETTNGTTVKHGSGLFFVLDLGDENSEKLYSVILTRKSFINDATEIKLFLQKFYDELKSEEPYLLTIPNNKTYVIQHPDQNVDLVAIPVGLLRMELDKKNIKISPLFFTEDYISKVEYIKPSDLSGMITAMNSRIQEFKH